MQMNEPLSEKFGLFFSDAAIDHKFVEHEFSCSAVPENGPSALGPAGPHGVGMLYASRPKAS